MKPLTFTPAELRFIGVLALFGLIVPNGIFLYYFFSSPEVMQAAMSNPISLVFISEAFLLMFLFAWLLRKVGSTQPSGFVFILMSLVGSMVFSVPAALWLAGKKRGSE